MMMLGFLISGGGWLVLALAPHLAWGFLAYPVMLLMFGTGAVFIFINFLGLRQSVTPAPMLGRMTATMRWLILLPAGPGALSFASRIWTPNSEPKQAQRLGLCNCRAQYGRQDRGLRRTLPRQRLPHEYAKSYPSSDCFPKRPVAAGFGSKP